MNNKNVNEPFYEISKSTKKEIELGICKCCGCMYGFSTIKHYTIFACDGTKKINEPCIYHGKCAPAVDCPLNLLDEKQEQDALLLFERLKKCWDEYKIILLEIPNEESSCFKKFMKIIGEKKWLIGEIHDPHGKYYRIFPTKNDYISGLIEAYTQGFQELDELGIEVLKKLGINMNKIEESIKIKETKELGYYIH